MKPVPGRNIAFGDGEETRQACLRCQKVIGIGVPRLVINPIADSQQLARLVEQEAELHLLRKRAANLGDAG